MEVQRNVCKRLSCDHPIESSERVRSCEIIKTDNWENLSLIVCACVCVFGVCVEVCVECLFTMLLCTKDFMHLCCQVLCTVIILKRCQTLTVAWDWVEHCYSAGVLAQGPFSSFGDHMSKCEAVDRYQRLEWVVSMGKEGGEGEEGQWSGLGAFGMPNRRGRLSLSLSVCVCVCVWEAKVYGLGH